MRYFRTISGNTTNAETFKKALEKMLITIKLEGNTPEAREYYLSKTHNLFMCYKTLYLSGCIHGKYFRKVQHYYNDFVICVRDK